MLAIDPVAPVALHRDDGLGNGERVLGAAEPEHVRDAGIGVGLAMGHAHAATDGDIPTRDLLDKEIRDVGARDEPASPVAWIDQRAIGVCLRLIGQDHGSLPASLTRSSWLQRYMRLPCSLRPLCPHIGMKVAAVAGARHEPGANDEFAEAFAVTALGGVSGEYRVERRHDASVVKILAVKLGKS